MFSWLFRDSNLKKENEALRITNRSLQSLASRKNAEIAGLKTELSRLKRKYDQPRDENGRFIRRP